MKQMALALADNGQQRSVVLGAPVQLAPTTELDQVEARVHSTAMKWHPGWARPYSAIR